MADWANITPELLRAIAWVLTREIDSGPAFSRQNAADEMQAGACGAASMMAACWSWKVALARERVRDRAIRAARRSAIYRQGWAAFMREIDSGGCFSFSVGCLRCFRVCDPLECTHAIMTAVLAGEDAVETCQRIAQEHIDWDSGDFGQTFPEDDGEEAEDGAQHVIIANAIIASICGGFATTKLGTLEESVMDSINKYCASSYLQPTPGVARFLLSWLDQRDGWLRCSIVFDTLASDQRFRPLVGAARFAALVAECKTRIGGWADYNED